MTRKFGETKRISPHEWISDYFSPKISILGSSAAEELALKNNLTLVELLQPFSKLNSEVTLKDPEGVHHSVNGLGVSFADFNKDPIRLVTSKLISDTVGSIVEEKTVSRFGLDAPAFTPWFDVWMKLCLATVPNAEHEFLSHHLGLIFFVSTSETDPISSFRSLAAKTKTKIESSPESYPAYWTIEPFMYYVLVHDARSSIPIPPDVFSKVQSAFGSTLCHFLTINSGEDVEGLNDIWFSPVHRFRNIDTRLDGVTTVSPPTPELNNATPQLLENPKSNQVIDHPLAAQSDEHSDPSIPVPKLKPANHENTARKIGLADVEKLQKFVREIIIQCLIPYSERQMRTLFEVVTNRKSRSIFSGAKRWFGHGKSGASAGTSVVYGKEAPELQVRKLGDLYFMLKLYKHSFICYNSVKKDFHIDEAWNYYAGAAEMTALSVFMQNIISESNPKKYPSETMADAITKYQQVCQMPEFALRATLFDALCLKFLGMHQESANSYIRMTTETRDLRSGLLLEQAAYCFLHCSPPLIRKYAFHIILSAYRFSKSGQKKHSYRTYNQGFQVYKNHDWALSEDHILYNLGHLAFLLKDSKAAGIYFNELFSRNSGSQNSLQQICHLKEFFIVQHLLEKEEKNKFRQIPLPKFYPQELILDLNDDRALRYDILLKTKESLSLERMLVNKVSIGPEELTKSGRSVYGPHTSNDFIPQACAGEGIRYLIPASNPFGTPLLLKSVKLIWEFTLEDGEIVDHKDKEAEKYVFTDCIDSVILEKGAEKVILTLRLRPARPGSLKVSGLEYSLKAQFPKSETTDYVIKGFQPLTLIGPRIHSMKILKKYEKKDPIYGPDYRLQAFVRSSQPKLEVKFLTVLPDLLDTGEVRTIELEFFNSGRVSLSRLSLASFYPGFFSFKAKIIEYPIIEDRRFENQFTKGNSEDSILDIIPLPLEKPLDPGKTIKLTLWIRAPFYKMPISPINFYFYYENGSPKPKELRYRILPKMLQFGVIPRCKIGASLIPSAVCRNGSFSYSTLSIKVNNISDKTTHSEAFKIDAIHLVSYDKVIDSWYGCPQSAISVDIAEIYSLVCNVIIDVKSSSLKYSGFSVDEKNEPVFQNDWLKPFFNFNVKPPVLKTDLIVLSWSDSSRKGVTFGEIVSENSCISLPISKTEIFVDVEPKIIADFRKRKSWSVPIKISAINRSKDSEVYVNYSACTFDENDEEEQNMFFGPVTGVNIRLVPEETKTFNLTVVVTSPGLYHFHNGFKFSLSETPRVFTSKIVPELNKLDIGFVVESACDE